MSASEREEDNYIEEKSEDGGGFWGTLSKPVLMNQPTLSLFFFFYLFYFFFMVCLT